jgi:hypothetical protein
MKRKEDYCFTTQQCARFINENAPITSRGVFRESWRRADGAIDYATILILHAKKMQAFCGVSCQKDF